MLDNTNKMERNVHRLKMIHHVIPHAKLILKWVGFASRKGLLLVENPPLPDALHDTLDPSQTTNEKSHSIVDQG